MKLISVTSYLA